MNLSRFANVFKAIRSLGVFAVALNGLYRLCLTSGYYRVANRPPSRHRSSGRITELFNFPSREQLLNVLGADGLNALRAEADEIVAGKFRQFGAAPVEIKLAYEQPLAHWSVYEKNAAMLAPFNLPHNDIKFAWEPARFGWAFVLGRAFILTGDERYAETFWRNFETFTAANPPYMGANWMSGQEVAIRLMAFVWASQAFAPSERTTPQRVAALAEAIAIHAERIPPTLIYARSQNNNHLLTESAGLYTAALALPGQRSSRYWRALGLKWLTWCFTHQIDSSGEYVQHSTNYHRLMLQVAVWVNRLARREGHRFPDIVNENLALATHWLYSILDPESGGVPNLGANDGALLFPLSCSDFSDYRPMVQAAARAFMSYTMPGSAWDEMALWFDLPRLSDQFETPRYLGDHLYAPRAWGFLRAIRYKSRPSHADQLHFDLWWRGLNVARDAGTYLYNAATPWDNRLSSALVHNTISVEGLDQMTRAGRFLYLDWADALPVRSEFINIASARLYAYSRLGVRLERKVFMLSANRWRVDDEMLNLLPAADKNLPYRTYRLHWLLPDWPCALTGLAESAAAEGRMGFDLHMQSLHGPMIVRVHYSRAMALDVHCQTRADLFRAGEYVSGNGSLLYPDPGPVQNMGWFSRTYGEKEPALSLVVHIRYPRNVELTTEFLFPD